MGTPVSGWDQMVRVRDFETKLDIINIRSSLVCDFNTLEQRIWEGAQKGPLLYDMHIHKEIGDCGAIDILTKQEWHSKQLLVGARIHLYAHLLPKTRDIGRKPQPKHPRGPPRVERDCVNELSPRDARYPESITYNRSESTVSGKKSSANEDFNKDDAEHEDVLPYYEVNNRGYIRKVSGGPMKLQHQQQDLSQQRQPQPNSYRDRSPFREESPLFEPESGHETVPPHSPADTSILGWDE